jgi:outer membrane protein assembly factor BamB
LPRPLAVAVIARLDAVTGDVREGPSEAPWLQQADARTAVTITSDFSEIVVTDPVPRAERWRTSTPFQTSVLLDGDLVLVSSLGVQRTRAVAYSVADGSIVWEAEVPSPSILLSGDLVVSGRADDLVALDRATGRQLWEVHYETPGRPEKYSEAGWVPAISTSSGGETAAGVIVATEPYRD